MIETTFHVEHNGVDTEYTLRGSMEEYPEAPGVFGPVLGQVLLGEEEILAQDWNSKGIDEFEALEAIFDAAQEKARRPH